MVSRGSSKQVIVVDANPGTSTATIAWTRNGHPAGSLRNIPFEFDEENGLIIDTYGSPISDHKFEATNNILRISTGETSIGLWRQNCENSMLAGVYIAVGASSETTVTVDGLFATVRIGDRVDKLRYTRVDLDGKFNFDQPNRGIHLTYASRSDSLLLQSRSDLYVLLPAYIQTAVMRYDDETEAEKPGDSMEAFRQRAIESIITGFDL